MKLAIFAFAFALGLITAYVLMNMDFYFDSAVLAAIFTGCLGIAGEYLKEKWKTNENEEDAD